MSVSLAAINQKMNQFGMADRSQFFLTLADLPEDTCLVSAVQVDNQMPMSLHNDHRIAVTVVFTEPVRLETLQGKPAVLHMMSQGELVTLSGLLEAWSDAPAVGRHAAVRLTLMSPLGLLRNQRHNRVFVDKDALSVAASILKNQLSEVASVVVNAQQPKAQALITQYHETDYDFVRRILAKEGIFLHCGMSDGQATVTLLDDITQSPSANDSKVLPFMSDSGQQKDVDCIMSVAQISASAPADIRLNDYNPDLDASLEVEAHVETQGAYGVDERWGLNYEDADAGSALALRLSQWHQWQMQQVEFTTSCRSILPGSKIQLTHHPVFKGYYHVISVRFSGDQHALSGGDTAKQFRCSVVAIPAALTFVPQQMELPSNPTVFTAHIQEEVDEFGQYRIQFPFDHRPEDNDQPSPPVRMMQPFGGADHGMHFPLAKGTEVVVSAMNGDLDRPLILGALYNGSSANVVTVNNHRDNIIRTRAGNELIMHDGEGKASIQLNTPEALNRLRLDATTDQHLVELHTEEGDMKLIAGKSISMDAGTSMDITVGENYSVSVAGDQSLVTEQGAITIDSGADIELSAANHVRWQAKTSDIQLEAGANMTLHAGGSRFDKVATGDYQIDVQEGDFGLQAKGKVVLASDSRVSLVVGNSVVQLNGSSLVIDAQSVDINAEEITIKGGKAGNN